MQAEIKQSDTSRREACRLRKAIRELLAGHPDGLTQAEIINLLARGPALAGTRRNLEFQTRAILQDLADKGKVERAKGPGAAAFKWKSNNS